MDGDTHRHPKRSLMESIPPFKNSRKAQRWPSALRRHATQTNAQASYRRWRPNCFASCKACVNANKDDSDRYLMTPLHSATLLKFDVRRKTDDQ